MILEKVDYEFLHEEKLRDWAKVSILHETTVTTELEEIEVGSWI